MNEDKSWDGKDYMNVWVGIGLASFFIALGMGSCEYLINKSERKLTRSQDPKEQRQVEKKNSLEYSLPGDFKDIISISYMHIYGNDVRPVLTYRTHDGEIKSQLYGNLYEDTERTTNTQPITWVQQPSTK